MLPRGEKRFGVGGNINISCTTDGYPVPQVTWYKDNAPLEESSRVQITGEYLIVLIFTWTMTYLNDFRHKFGRVQC